MSFQQKQQQARAFSSSPVAAIRPQKALSLEATRRPQAHELQKYDSTSLVQRLPEFDLTGKVILITGGVGGVGIQQSEALMEAGAIVYALDRVDDAQLPAEYYRLKDRGASELHTTFGYRQADVRNPTQLHDITRQIADKHSRLDGIIAAAGINRIAPALRHSQHAFDEVMSINVTGAFLCAQAAAEQMVRFGNGGSIVLIASMSGTIANKGMACAAYNSSKAAVLQLARSLAMEWGPYGIRINTISPGYIETAMVDVMLKDDPKRAKTWPRDNMLGRLSRPEEYRGAAVFLLSDASSYMTGSDLIMDGGHHSW
ncbi:short chain dehydrogenase [Peziza echinospora]|nr:short chain dehydrogenase [Peziza echinospora]